MPIESKELDSLSHLMTYERYIEDDDTITKIDKHNLITKFKSMSDDDQANQVKRLMRGSRKNAQHKSVTDSQIKTK